MHTSKYADWIKTLLTKNELRHPDGRPLYAYRISDDDFSYLIELLKRKSVTPFSSTMKQDGFKNCWFIYASEWWKRCYEGGSWSWAPIFNSIGFEDQSHDIRQELVSSASNYFRLNDEVIGGKRYIGKVVVNGGLPLRLIKEAGGALSRLLKAVLTDASSSSSPLNDIQLLELVKLQQTHLPKSYHQDSVYQLLAKMAAVVLELKSNCIGVNEPDSIAYLNKNHPEWMQRFPLNVDENAAKQLLGGLIRHAVATYQRPRQPFAITRQIRFNHDQSEWEYECAFDAASRHPANEMSNMLGTTEELPASMDLLLHAERATRTVGQLLRRGDNYIITVNKANLPTEWFHQSLRLEVSRLGRVLGALEVQGSEGPDPAAPWVFEDTHPISRLNWVGSAKLADATCLIITPKSATIFSMEDNEELRSHFDGKKLLRLSDGNVHITMQKESFQVTCSAPQPNPSVGVVWGKNRIFLDSTPAHIFIGLPPLYRVTDSGERYPVPKSELFWRCNEETLTFDKVNNYGAGVLFWRKDDKILQRLKAVCLPGLAGGNARPRIEFVYCREILPTGKIKLHGWPIASVICNTANVQMSTTHIDNNWTLCFTSQESPPPLKVQLTLKWPDGQSQNISLPFPIEGAFVVNDNDEYLRKKSRVSLHDIKKLRVHLRSQRQQGWKIEIRLHGCDEAEALPSQTIDLHPSPGYATQEIRLFDMQNQIRQVLSLTNSLDAQVHLKFISPQKTQNTLVISRYSHTISRNKSKGWVTLSNDHTEMPTLEQLSNSSLHSLPILAADHLCMTLSSVNSEGTHVGSWDFHPEGKAPGTWLIYPSPETATFFRPIAWTIPSHNESPPL